MVCTHLGSHVSAWCYDAIVSSTEQTSWRHGTLHSIMRSSLLERCRLYSRSLPVLAMSSSAPLLQASLVGFAYASDDRKKTLPKHQKIIQKELDGIHHVDTIDVRKALPVDPAQGGVSHTQNGTRAHTQQAAFSMEHYTELLA